MSSAIPTTTRPSGPARRPTTAPLPGRGPDRADVRRRLTVVPPAAPSRAPARAARTPFVVLVLLMIAGGFLGLLLLNTTITQDAFTVAQLEERANLLVDREQALEQQLAVEASPQRLAERAAEIGMVPAGAPAFIDTTDGSVLGVPTPAEDLPPELVSLLSGAGRAP